MASTNENDDNRSLLYLKNLTLPSVVVIAANMGCNVCQGRVSRVVSKMTGKTLQVKWRFLSNGFACQIRSTAGTVTGNLQPAFKEHFLTFTLRTEWDTDRQWCPTGRVCVGRNTRTAKGPSLSVRVS
ncbi:uncharacterized protein [Cicer arietinum]|uniref:Uncharacterized protein LOC101500647 isoform X2 n=1 Tax=Cicer arietinum TaxID=3827 RepID=A0A3Q7YC61_CICAR|nr:uncharacterized protein LOC101500647 isoform X2 [Cicer arietinum]